MIEPIQPPLIVGAGTPSLPSGSKAITDLIHASLGEDQWDIGEVWITLTKEIVELAVAQRIVNFDIEVCRILQRVGMIAPSPIGRFGLSQSRNEFRNERL